MATTGETTRQQYHRPQQSQQRERSKSNTHVYTLYPDPPLRRSSIIQLPPSPSQLLPKKASSQKAGAQVNGRHQNPQPTVSTQTHNAKLSSPQPQYRTYQQQQQQQLQLQQQHQGFTISAKGTLPSPVSPSSSAPAVFTNGDTNGTNDVPRFDKTQYQHPRQTAQSNRQYSHHSPQLDPIYGGTVPRQTGSSTLAHKHGHAGHAHEHDVAPRLQPSFGQYQNGLKQNASSPSNSPRPGQLISPTASPRSDRPTLHADIPSSSLFLSFDREDQEHEKHHQQQALQYQQKLHQRPPKQSGEDTDDDSDSGSIQSYRRSVHRMSMTFKGRPGVPNISLFSPNQRAQIVQFSRSPTGSPIKEQEEWQHAPSKGSPVYNQQNGSKGGNQGSGSSLASIDQSGSQARYMEDGRPRAVRAHTVNNPSSPRPKEIQIPERSVSVDHIYKQNNNDSRTRQVPPHWKDHPYPVNHQPDNTDVSSRSSNIQQFEPRPSHESAQSVRVQYTKTRPEAQNGFNGAARGGGGAGAGFENRQVGIPPAHHIVKGGYVRPEEAVGPSNPMPERAEDYVRKGIENHEDGDLSKATQFFRTAAELGDPVGMLMYGLSVRHGWGCTANRVLAFQYLQKSAEHAVGDLNSRDAFTSTAAKGELILAIYELGICFRHGWGAEKNKKTAAYYFEIAANLGDPDAQNDLAWCHYHGVGVKKDMYKSAKYYRMAAAQGMEQMGNSWIWKDKYGGPNSPTAVVPVEKNLSEMIPILLPHN